MTNTTTRGKQLQDKLNARLHALQHGPAANERKRPVLWGVTGDGTLVGGRTLDSFLAEAGRILIESARVYRWENTVVYDFREPEDQHLLILSVRGKAEPQAASVLTNLFGVGFHGKEGPRESLVPPKLVSALLADEDLWQRLPLVKTYARRAVYDEDFTLCGPGWHPEQSILVHGPDITPAGLPPAGLAPAEPPAVAQSPAAASIHRLPSCLWRLLQDFCWAEAADLENALGLLLTGLLANHFVSDPKPIGLIDGNQQEIGKTLLAQVFGQVLDGHEPERIPLTRDDELEKKVGAKLRESRSGIFFFDNIKAKIDSAFLEASALSPLLSVRLLGHSQNINRPNTYLWLITSNLTSGSSDTITRGVPVRLRYEGNPVERTFHENPLAYAAGHRLDLLGELAGMVERWKQAGRPLAQDADAWPAGRPAPQHRCKRWVEVIGGILAVNGFTNFLSNVEEARAAMDEGLQALATLAEHALTANVPGFVNPPVNDVNRGKLPREWATLFAGAHVYHEKLSERNARGKETWIGTFLSGKTDRVVSIMAGQHCGTAILRRNPVRNDQKRYYFEITDAPVASAPQPGSPPAANPGEVPGAAASTPTQPAITPTATGAAGQSSAEVFVVSPPPATGAPGVGVTGNDLQWV
jgi:hypothetical protein